ncbi:hypothetical protein [Fodinicola acaciae]|uniref:hypothetical protein n=1 Tax=Fodinicola acaciae TaxID=2681555 RepID=UPI0013D79074|nr:hypothetical protein [Fodinicola acaciae]
MTILPKIAVRLATAGHVMALRRQVVHARLEATQLLRGARARDDQRKVDHYSGKALAFQTVIDMIDTQFHTDHEHVETEPDPTVAPGHP